MFVKLYKNYITNIMTNKKKSSKSKVKEMDFYSPSPYKNQDYKKIKNIKKSACILFDLMIL